MPAAEIRNVPPIFGGSYRGVRTGGQASALSQQFHNVKRDILDQAFSLDLNYPVGLVCKPYYED